MELKNDPNGCYAKALPDEPMFILLARDPAAPATIEFWANQRDVMVRTGRLEPHAEQLMGAMKDVVTLENWRKDHDGEWRGEKPEEDRPTPSDEVSSVAGRLLQHEDPEVRKLAGFVLRADREDGPNTLA